MVHPIVVATAAILTLTAGALAQVDFTPKEAYYLAEATKVPCVSFRDGSNEVLYSQPVGWTLSGGGNKVTMHPPSAAQAEATMRVAPLKQPVLPVTEENAKAYGELIVKDLPQEASKVTIAEAGVSSFSLSKRPIMEVTYSYALYGQQFTSKVLFLPRDKDQIVFQITTRSADFEPLARVFRSSLYSLQGL